VEFNLDAYLITNRTLLFISLAIHGNKDQHFKPNLFTIKPIDKICILFFEYIP
jgi:hypothetical protein